MEESKTECVNCQKEFSDEEYGKIHFLDTGGHIVCKLCFSEIADRDFGETDAIVCPECKTPISDYEIRVLLGDEEHEKLQKRALQHVIDEGKV